MSRDYEWRPAADARLGVNLRDVGMKVAGAAIGAAITVSLGVVLSMIEAREVVREFFGGSW